MEIRLHSLQGIRSVIYNVVVFETSVFDRPHENDKQAFFKNDLHAGERFWKDAFSVTVFTQYVWTVGHRIRVDGAQKISCARLEIFVDFVFNSSPLNIFLRFFQQQEAPRFLAHFKGKFIIHKVQSIYSLVLLF